MGIGGGTTRDPNMVAWEQILKNINNLFEGENFDPDSVNSWVQGVVTILVKDEAIREQVNANSKEQFRESRTIEEAVTNAALDHHDAQNNILEKFFESPQRRAAVIREISDLIYWELSHVVQRGEQDEIATGA